MKRLLLTATLVLALGGPSHGAGAQTVGAQPAGGDLLSKLSDAERELLLATAGVSGADRFLPGQLPPALPYRAPALPGQTVLGGVVQPSGSVVVVRTTAGEDAAQAAAQAALRADGWTDQYPRGSGESVFQTALGGPERAFYPLCKPGTPGSLTVTSFALQDRPGTQVAYRYTTFVGGSGQGCPSNMGREGAEDRNYYAPEQDASFKTPAQVIEESGARVPSLPAPPGAQVEQSGSRWDGSSFDVYVKIFSSQGLGSLRDAYVGALKAQGWTVTGTSTLNGEQLTRFKYKLGDQEREGVLSIVARPELGRDAGGGRLNRYDAQLRMAYR